MDNDKLIKWIEENEGEDENGNMVIESRELLNAIQNGELDKKEVQDV